MDFGVTVELGAIIVHSIHPYGTGLPRSESGLLQADFLPFGTGRVYLGSATIPITAFSSQVLSRQPPNFPALPQGPGRVAMNWLKCVNPDWGN